jgi:cobalt transporter subunit CbtB
MQTQSTSTAVRGTTISTVIPRALQLLGAFLLGMAVVYGAGFVQTAEVHNAAHDMRHSQGFPCH